MYVWLCWVFISVRGLSLVAASRGHSSSRCAGLSLSRPLLLRSTGSRRAGSAVVAHGPSCSAACGIFPDQGSNPRPLHWQADSQPLRHQGSPLPVFLFFIPPQPPTAVIPQICHHQYLQSLPTFHFKHLFFLVHALWHPESKNSSIPLGRSKHRFTIYCSRVFTPFVSLLPSLPA